MLVVLATACSGPVDRGGPSAAPTTAEATTTTSPTTTTTAPLPADLEDLVAATTMTERARRLFAAARPAIEDPTTFAQSCGIVSRADPGDRPRTHTHGCFVAGRIHLLARTEARELLYVAAAHELLHAAYESLGSSERSRVDAEVEAARTGNERLEERLEAYGSIPTLANEMHSILGSEFDGLSAALEAHYAQFFTNRAAVVAARQRVVGTREDEIRRLKAQIEELGARITTLEAAQEERRAARDVSAYNAAVPVVNGLIIRYNALIDALNAHIDEFNALLGG